MTSKILSLALLIAAVSSNALAQQTESSPAASPTPTMSGKSGPADQPRPRTGYAKFFERHEQILKRGKEGPIGLLFLGDSITEYWNRAPEVWAANYEKYQAANFGIGGDRTQYVLWRIENGELDGIAPKVVVLMIGTNNTADYTAPEITAGVKAIVAGLQAKLPESKVLLLGIFPRGPRKQKGGAPEDYVAKMETIRAVNADLAKMDNGSTVRYLDIGPKFLNEKGEIPGGIMPDQLHLGPAGYQIWADSMRPLLEEMMGGPKAP